MSKLPGEVATLADCQSNYKRCVGDVNELLHIIRGEVEAHEFSDMVKVQDRRGQEAKGLIPNRFAYEIYKSHDFKLDL